MLTATQIALLLAQGHRFHAYMFKSGVVDGWKVRVVRTDKNIEYYLADTRGKVAIFRTVDGALNRIALCGLPSIIVYIPKEAQPRRDEEQKESGRPLARGKHIPKTLNHDAGAYGQCQKCRRYSDKVTAMATDTLRCDCGALNMWTGSFKKPDESAVWSEAE